MRTFHFGGFTLLLIACAAADESALDLEPAAGDEPLGTAQSAVASVMGGADVGVDAPWRLEPIGDNEALQTGTYAPIPIVVSLSDAALQRDPETAKPYGTFCGVRIHEHWHDGQTHIDPLTPQSQYPNPPTWQLDTVITPTDPALREIERSDKWTYSSDIAANHRLCRHWRGDDCANVLNASTSAEWHATVSYIPQQLIGAGTRAQDVSPIRSGDDVTLTITANFATQGMTCAQTQHIQSFSEDVTIHLGEARLPRFGDGWVYGDLHYHSQGTDNEGENGYAYRPTLQAMRALGLDFVVATEHASDSGQVTDLDPLFIDVMPDIPYVPEFLEEQARDVLNTLLERAPVVPNVAAARDMSPARFAYLRKWLNRPATDPNPGANAEAMRAFSGGARAPRIFLGGEIDVIPEISELERHSGLLVYGNNKTYRWGEPCWSLPAPFLAAGQYTTFDACPGGASDLLDPASEGGRYMLMDIQGLLERYYARQHIVYLPKDGTRDDAFVSSRSTRYGGAHERLKDIVRPDYANTMSGKGYGFLAHPMAHESGSGIGRLGPDIVPYSDVQLKTAFDSPSVLGLEFWNEDNRIRDGVWLGSAPPEYWDLHNGAFAWDKMLEWGLRTSQTASLSWVPAGMPRRVFMAGGSDAHGDWNYRREGSLTGTSHRVDGAIGKPRNLVDVGLGRPESVLGADGSSVGVFTQQQLANSLSAGAFSVTDGPAMRIAIDQNGNGVIDAGDVPMGGIGDIGAGTFNVILEWLSTTEFQPIASLDVYIGVASGASDHAVVFAPVNHGARINDGTGVLDPIVYRHGAIRVQKLKDGYMADPTGNLHIVPTSADYVNGSPYHGRRVLQITASNYPVGEAKNNPVLGERVCTPNVWCHKPGHIDQCKITCQQTVTNSYEYVDAETPNRMYVRAFARTKVPAICNGTSAASLDWQRRGKCIERLGYTNPVWAIPKPPIGSDIRGRMAPPAAVVR